MFSFIHETNVWDRLRTVRKPIVLYGMGDGAIKIMNAFKQYGIRLDAIFASDEFVRGHSFQGYTVQTYQQICAKYTDFIIVLAFATHLVPVLERLRTIHHEHEIVAPDVPIAGGGLFTREYVQQHLSSFNQAYGMLEDDISRQTFADILNYKISGKIQYLFRCFADKAIVYKELLQVNSREHFVDLGAYDGDTIREFLEASNGQYQSITAVEPDAKNYKKLQRYLKESNLKGIQTYNTGIWNRKTSLPFMAAAGRNSKISITKGTAIPVDTVDNLLRVREATFIKMDVEGCEYQALEGAEKTILRYKPKLYVCAYHRNEDLYALPLKIKELWKGYKIYLRHSPYIPAWETNLYCVP